MWDRKDKMPLKKQAKEMPKPAPSGSATVPVQDSQSKLPSSKGRTILLSLLSVAAVLLLGMLILLIYHMPRKPVNLQAVRQTPAPTEDLIRESTLPSETENLIPIEMRASSTPIMLVSRSMSNDSMAELLSRGAGVSPGVLEVPSLLKTAPREPAVQAPLPTIPGADELPPTEEPLMPPPIPEQPVGMQLGENFVASGMTAYIYGEVVNVRQDASTASPILFESHSGVVVEEIEKNDSWSRVRFPDGFEGYIYSNLLSYNYVAPSQPPEALASLVQTPAGGDGFEAYSGVLYASNSGVNIRQGPSTNHAAVGSMYYGDYVTAIGYSAGWFKIEWYDGEVAYVHGDYLQVEPIDQAQLNQEIVHEGVNYVAAQVASNPANLAGGAAVVSTAMKYVGYPYVWGACGPNSFDCSGLVQYVYAQMGVKLGRTTYDQVNEGIPVNFAYRDYSNLVPGDIVLFAQGTDIYHSGIYIGGGQMVHAGTANTGVIIDDLNLEYYASRLAHVRRIFY